jgi:hypothetical protein
VVFGLAGSVADVCASGEGLGWGPRADIAVIAEHPARDPGIGVRVLQGPYRSAADAGHVVAVPDRVPGGLDPGHPGVPGSVPLVLLPAQQVPDAIPG